MVHVFMPAISIAPPNIYPVHHDKPSDHYHFSKPRRYCQCGLTVQSSNVLEQIRGPRTRGGRS